MILFKSASKEELAVLKEVIFKLEVEVGKIVNKEQSLIFFFNLRKEVQCIISLDLGFNIGFFPSKYLGVPLFLGQSKSSLWEATMGKCSSRSSS